MTKLFGILFATLLCLFTKGQSRLNQNAVISYKYNNKQLQFNIYAPLAKDVKLAGWDIMSYTGNTRSGDKPFPGIPLQKDSSGIWSLTLPNMEAQPYQYFFWVDGVRTLDPSNKEVLETYQQPFSIAEVKQKTEQAFWQMGNVPHGTVHYLTYYSPVLKMDRPLVVYTPPGYENSNQQFPVLYLLHGAGEISSSWVKAGKANNIADNLFATGKAKPCIIVMPFGHPDGYSGRADSSLLGGTNRFSWMEKELLDVIIPYTEKAFRAKSDKWNRAIAGLSMGGAQTTYIGLRHLETFSYVGVFSAGDKDIATSQAGFFSNSAEANKQLKLLFVGVGEWDRVGNNPAQKESGIIYNAQAMIKAFETAGIKHRFRLLPKTDHTWYAWRTFLNDDFLPALWK